MTKAEYTKFVKGIVDATRKLIAKTPDDKLTWRPDESFMKLGSVVEHASASIGDSLRRALDSDWHYEKNYEGDGLPPADAIPVVDPKKGLERINADWEQFEKRFVDVGDEEFNTRVIEVPWMPKGSTLSDFMMLMAEHLSNHRMQLFMYLRMLGLPLNTAHLYGGE